MLLDFLSLKMPNMAIHQKIHLKRFWVSIHQCHTWSLPRQTVDCFVKPKAIEDALHTSYKGIPRAIHLTSQKHVVKSVGLIIQWADKRASVQLEQFELGYLRNIQWSHSFKIHSKTPIEIIAWNQKSWRSTMPWGGIRLAPEPANKDSSWFYDSFGLSDPEVRVPYHSERKDTNSQPPLLTTNNIIQHCFQQFSNRFFHLHHLIPSQSTWSDWDLIPPYGCERPWHGRVQSSPLGRSSPERRSDEEWLGVAWVKLGKRNNWAKGKVTASSLVFWAFTRKVGHYLQSWILFGTCLANAGVRHTPNTNQFMIVVIVPV